MLKFKILYLAYLEKANVLRNASISNVLCEKYAKFFAKIKKIKLNNKAGIGQHIYSEFVKWIKKIARYYDQVEKSL